MRSVGFISVLLLFLFALAGCSIDEQGAPRLSFAGDDVPRSQGYLIVPGAAAHDTAYMDPYDPTDQQLNQGHGLTVSPNEPSYFSQFLRF